MNFLKLILRTAAFTALVSVSASLYGQFTWDLDGNGTWSVAGNWTPVVGAPPNAVGDTANFGTVITANRTITVNINVTVGQMNFLHPTPNREYNIVGANTITFDASVGNATLTVNMQDRSRIAAPVVLTDDLDITNFNSNNFRFQGNISGGGGINLKGGRLTFQSGGTSSYTGDTIIEAGQLRLNRTGFDRGIAGDLEIGNGVGGIGSALVDYANRNNQISNTSAVTIFRDGRLDLTGENDRIGSLATSGASPQFAQVFLGGGTLTAGNASNTTFAGVISEAGNFVKEGNGTLILSNNNTYTGTTTINNGILQISNGDALGTAAGDTFVNSGGTLALAGGITTPTAEFIDIAGVGEGGIGAISNTSGSNSWRGDVDLTADATIGAQAGRLTFTNDDNVDLNGSDLTLKPLIGASLVFEGVIFDAPDSSNLFKEGLGLAIFNASNTYDALTTVKAGTLQIENNLALGDFGPGKGTVVESGATLALAGGINTPNPELLTLSGPGNAVKAALWSQSGSNEWDGNVILVGTGASFGANAASTLTVDGVISGGPLQTVTIEGSVVVEWADPMTYTGDTNITSGTLRYVQGRDRISDSSAVTVSLGATYDLNNRNDTIGSLAGAGSVTLDTATLTTGADDTSTTFSGIISETGSLVKVGDGTFTLTNNNTYAGTTTINNGILQIENNDALGTGFAFVNSGGTLALAGSITTPTGDFIDIAGTGEGGIGAISNTSGSNFWRGDFDLTADATIGAQAGTLTFTSDDDVDLMGFDLTVKPGSGASLVFEGVIFDTPASSNLFKEGLGLAVFNAANTYRALTTVKAGTLRIQNGSALGTTAAGTVVNTGATLDLLGGITVTGEALTLNGTGAGAGIVGALRNNSGINTWTGGVTLGSDATINSVAGTLSVTGDITGGGNNLTVTGAGSTTTSGAISGAGTALIKQGGGTWLIDGTTANTFTGVTTITAGTMSLGKTAGLDAISGANINITGGTLLLAASNQIAAATNMNLNGGTFSTAGFDESLASLTLSSTSTINVGAGGSIINYTGGTYSAGQLNIDSWAGSFSGGSSDQIIFGTSLTQAFLDNVAWTDQGITGAFQLPSGEIVPIPEPATIFSGALLIGLIGFDFYRRRKSTG